MVNSTYKANKIVDLSLLLKSIQGKKELMQDVIDAFLKQALADLLHIKEAIHKMDCREIKRQAHSMKSTVSIFGVSVLSHIPDEMETSGNIDLIRVLSHQLDATCNQARR